MKAILLSAGFGTRLKPLTNNVPKCLMPINGTPILGRWIRALSDIGVSEFIINTHYLHEQVSDYIELINKNNHYKIHIKHEVKLLGTAGTLLKNQEFVDDNTFIVHADNYCYSNLRKFVNDHANRPSKCLMTMMTFVTETPSECGIVNIDSNMIVQNFYEKNLDYHGNIANAAIYMISKQLINSIKDNQRDAIDISNDIIPNYIGKIFTSPCTGSIIDIGTFENYSKANSLAKAYENK